MKHEFVHRLFQGRVDGRLRGRVGDLDKFLLRGCLTRYLEDENSQTLSF